MDEKWLNKNYMKVKANKNNPCHACAFNGSNQEMGYDFCGGIPCHPYHPSNPYIYIKRQPKPKTRPTRRW